MMSLGLKRVKPSTMFRSRVDIRCPDAARSPETVMFIQTEETPNPATLKFLPGRVVMDRGTADFDAADKAARSPLAESLFRIDGVARIFLGSDFITVTKTDEKDWPVLKPQILGLIMEHFSSNRPVILSDDSAPPQSTDGAADEDDEIVAQIKELLETRVRPAVAQDGGDIIFHAFEDGIVYLHMQGSCSGCPSSTATLKMGIENMLRHYVPEVVEVRPV
jgi:Fe-S cluster biogenesis protein NfuA